MSTSPVSVLAQTVKVYTVAHLSGQLEKIERHEDNDVVVLRSTSGGAVMCFLDS